MSDYVSDESGPDAQPIERLEQLVEHFARGAKPREEWRIGTEYERLAVDRRSGRAIPFSGPRGVEAILRGLADRYGWEPQEEGGRIIGLKRSGGEITLEPGGQLELSGQPHESVHQARVELERHVEEVQSITSELDVAILGLGMQPFSTLDEIEWVPKRRYAIMGPYMRKVGSLGQRMMKQTATVQVNLDFSSEKDAIEKMRTATGIGPIVNAIFANSPICDGAPNGFLSYRAHVWTDTDPARTGLLPFLFDPGASFERYAEWALDAPMYFVKRKGDYVDMTGVPFRRFWREGANGLRATVGDFALHLSTLFPEVRLKTYIELRMTDSQPHETMLGLPAIAKGVLYEPDCLQAAWDLVKGLSLAERLEVHRAVPAMALAAPIKRYRIGDLARELLAIAEEGLRRQGLRDAGGATEAIYLEPLHELVRSGKTRAERLLAEWERTWERRSERFAETAAYGRTLTDRERSAS
jgi:glutamate--cysteine ligase